MIYSIEDCNLKIERVDIKAVKLSLILLGG